MKTLHVFLLWSLFLVIQACQPSVRYYTAPYHNENALLQVAHSWLGVRYRYGGNDRSGIDCSGLVQQIFRSAYGLELPRQTRQLLRLGRTVSLQRLKPADLLFFSFSRYNKNQWHVAVYLGQGRFIHASVKKGVVIDSLGNPYYKRHLIKARRLLK